MIFILFRLPGRGHGGTVGVAARGRKKGETNVTKNSKKWMLALGVAAMLAPGVKAGCGKQLTLKLSALPPASEQAESRSVVALARAEDTPLVALSGVGLWAVNVTLSGQTIYQAFESFTIDGLEFLNDNGSPLEGNVCFGAWTASSRNTIKVYHPSWSYDMNGNLIGTVVIKEQIVLDPGGNSFKGTVVVDSYDLNGKVSGPELQAQLSGKRITAN
jgi:hypothetical protein